MVTWNTHFGDWQPVMAALLRSHNICTELMLWGLGVCARSFRAGPSGDGAPPSEWGWGLPVEEAPQSVTDRIPPSPFAVLRSLRCSKIRATPVGTFLYIETQIAGCRLSLTPPVQNSPTSPRLLLLFFLGVVFTASYWEWVYSRWFCPSLSSAFGPVLTVKYASQLMAP